MAELALPANRDKLRLSIVSGYGTAAAFGLLTAAAHGLGLVPFVWPLWGLVALKLAANTLALLSLRKGALVLETGGLNILSDLLCMTGAIYFTGGRQSPLLPIYF